jgi:PadR family transcriptional regulator PadR
MVECVSGLGTGDTLSRRRAGVDREERESRDRPRTPVAPEAEAVLRKFQKELNAGTVALVLLAVIERAEEPLYGYEIARGLETAGGAAGSIVKQGTLYPVLRALERAGLLQSRIGPSDAGPPRRYYEVTPDGRQTLADWRVVWQHTRDFVDTVVEGGSRVREH